MAGAVAIADGEEVVGSLEGGQGNCDEGRDRRFAGKRGRVGLCEERVRRSSTRVACERHERKPRRSLTENPSPPTSNRGSSVGGKTVGSSGMVDEPR